MTWNRRRATSPEAEFINAITEEINRSLPRASVIPVMQADPPTEDPTNMWMRPDGRLRGRYWNGSAFVYVDYPMRTDITAPPSVPAAPPPPPKPPAPKSYKKTYTADWTQTYQGDGDKRNDSRGTKYLVYGNGGDSFNGTQRSLIGFDYSTIQSNLSGSTIKKVQLRMTNVHAYWNSGVQIYFGVHNVSSEPSNWPGSGSLPQRRASHHKFGKPQTRTVTLPLKFGQLLRSGSGKGITIEAPSGDRDYYGYAAGVGSGYTPPQLIISYTK